MELQEIKNNKRNNQQNKKDTLQNGKKYFKAIHLKRDS